MGFRNSLTGISSTPKTEPFTVPAVSIVEWWVTPCLLRDYTSTNNSTYGTYSSNDGSIGVYVVDHNAAGAVNVYKTGNNTIFSPDDHSCGSIVIDQNTITHIIQGRTIITNSLGLNTYNMYYITWNKGSAPSLTTNSANYLTAIPFGTSGDTSNYPNAYNSNGQFFLIGRVNVNQGVPQWKYVLNSWPFGNNSFTSSATFFQSANYSWPYISISRSMYNKSKFVLVQTYHASSSNLHEIRYAEINRAGSTPSNPWDVLNNGSVIGNLTTGVGLPFNENSFELVYSVQANNPLPSLSSAVIAHIHTDTATGSNSITTNQESGTFTLTTTKASGGGSPFNVGDYVKVYQTSNPYNFIVGTVATFSGNNMTVTVTNSGSYNSSTGVVTGATDWTIIDTTATFTFSSSISSFTQLAIGNFIKVSQFIGADYPWNGIYLITAVTSNSINVAYTTGGGTGGSGVITDAPTANPVNTLGVVGTQSVRTFAVSDNTIVFALFDVNTNNAFYKYATKWQTNGTLGSTWNIYDINNMLNAPLDPVSGKRSAGIPYHGGNNNPPNAIRYYYAGISISHQDPFTITVAYNNATDISNQSNAVYYIQQMKSTDYGQNWNVFLTYTSNSNDTAGVGGLIIRPTDEQLTEESLPFDGLLHTISCIGYVDRLDYINFNTQIQSLISSGPYG
jgi:hypothetical protein